MDAKIAVDHEHREDLMDLTQFKPYDFPTDAVPTNVQDEFMNMTVEQIRDATAAGRSSMVTVCMNLTSDFNKASIVRSHSAFLGAEIFMVGKRKFDKRGTVGTHCYNSIYHSVELAPVIGALHNDGYTVVAIDNNADFECQVIYDQEIPAKTAFVFGEESCGLSNESLALCDSVAYIPQFGAAPRSLNVSAAAAIVMGEYSRVNR